MKDFIEKEERLAELNEFMDHLKDVDDTRDSWRLSYSLAEVLFIVFCAQINGFDSFTEDDSFINGSVFRI